MIKIILAILTITCILSGCGVHEHNAIITEQYDNESEDSKRFIQSDYNKNSYSVTRVITDTHTGQQYLFVRDRNCAGLTTLVHNKRVLYPK